MFTNVLTEKLSSKLLDDNRMQRQGATHARLGWACVGFRPGISYQPKIETLGTCLVSWSVAQADLVTVCCPKRKRPPESQNAPEIASQQFE